MPPQIITAHEADQIIRLKAPLMPLYSTWPHCSGPCQQGRSLCLTPEACQQVTADADEWEPLSLRDHLAFWVPVVAVTVGSLAGLLYLMGARL